MSRRRDRKGQQPWGAPLRIHRGPKVDTGFGAVSFWGEQAFLRLWTEFHAEAARLGLDRDRLPFAGVLDGLEEGYRPDTAALLRLAAPWSMDPTRFVDRVRRGGSLPDVRVTLHCALTHRGHFSVQWAPTVYGTPDGPRSDFLLDHRPDFDDRGPPWQYRPSQEILLIQNARETADAHEGAVAADLNGGMRHAINLMVLSVWRDLVRSLDAAYEVTLANDVEPRLDEDTGLAVGLTVYDVAERERSDALAWLAGFAGRYGHSAEDFAKAASSPSARYPAGHVSGEKLSRRVRTPTNDLTPKVAEGVYDSLVEIAARWPDALRPAMAPDVLAQLVAEVDRRRAWEREMGS